MAGHEHIAESGDPGQNQIDRHPKQHDDGNLHPKPAHCNSRGSFHTQDHAGYVKSVLKHPSERFHTLCDDISPDPDDHKPYDRFKSPLYRGLQALSLQHQA